MILKFRWGFSEIKEESKYGYVRLFNHDQFRNNSRDSYGEAMTKISCAERHLERVEKNYKECRYELFKLKYNMEPVDIMYKYAELVESSCTDNRTGCRNWLIGRNDLSNHVNKFRYYVNIELYDKCLPTQIDKDAYFTLYGEHMIVSPRDDPWC